MKIGNMYEMIMDLSLFKGLSHQQVSAFVEKTQLKFQSYQEGSLIIVPESECKSVKVVLNGEVCVTHKLMDGMLEIEEICGEGKVIGADRLFGINPHSVCTVRALTKVGVMEFSKEDYMQFIGKDQIFLLNFVNHLSLRCQQAADFFRQNGFADMERFLMFLRIVFGDKRSKKVFLNGRTKDISAFSGFELNEVERQLAELETAKKIERITESRILIANS